MISDSLRVLYPYEKTQEGWRRVSWKEAIGKISERLQKIIQQHGPQSVAFYYGAGTPTSSMNYVMADSFLRSLGSDRMYNVLTLEFTNRYLVMEKMYGSQFRVTQPDLEHTQCLLIFGSNPLISLDHPGIPQSLKDLKRRGGKLIVVDPRRTETAGMADIHAQIIPGTDLFLLQGIYSHLLQRELLDREFLKKHCSGWQFFESWKPLSPANAEDICGVPAETIMRIAEEFARVESACAICKLGINTSRHGTLTYWLIEALNALTGNLDRPGGLIFNPGVLDLDLLSRMAIGRKRRKSRVGGYPYLTGSYPASVLPEEILSDSPERVRALIVDAGDPSLVFPNSKRFAEAAKQLELLVSIDIYMNETAQLADFVLPAANFLEKDDLYVTFPDHFPYPFAQWSHKLVEPPAEARAEWEIFLMLARAMGRPLLNQRVMDVLFKAGASIDPVRFGFNPKNYYKLLLSMMGKVGVSKLLANPQGIKAGNIKFGDTLRKLPAGKVQVAPPEFAAAVKAASAPTKSHDNKFILISGERSPHTKNTNLRGLESLLRKQRENFVRLHPSDAQTLSISDADIVEIVTDKGSIQLKARIDDGMRPGVVSIPHGWGRILYHPEIRPRSDKQGANVNTLTDDSSLDSFTGMPLYNAIPCSLRKPS
jgi:formate dehydrogenase